MWRFCQKPSWHASGFLIQPGVASRVQKSFARLQKSPAGPAFPAAGEGETSRPAPFGSQIRAARAGGRGRASGPRPRAEGPSLGTALTRGGTHLGCKHSVQTKGESSLKRRKQLNSRETTQIGDQAFQPPILFVHPVWLPKPRVESDPRSRGSGAQTFVHSHRLRNKVHVLDSAFSPAKNRTVFKLMVRIVFVEPAGSRPSGQRSFSPGPVHWVGAAARTPGPGRGRCRTLARWPRSLTWGGGWGWGCCLGLLPSLQICSWGPGTAAS